jgi:hypothetical protein
MEPKDATIIRCIFLELNPINLNMFRASLCPSSGEQERDWLKQASSHEVLTSLVLVLLVMGIMMHETC